MTAIVTGMYLFAGFRDALVAVEHEDEARAERVKGAMGGGEVECAQTISGYAFPTESMVNHLYDEHGGNFPGVWEYEVGEELGRWLFEFVDQEDGLPTAERWQEEVLHRTLEFIRRNNPA